jgi:hypothetical protein
MMGGYGWAAQRQAILSVEEATQAAEDYLQSSSFEAWRSSVIFDNCAYVEVEDPALDMGAFSAGRSVTSGLSGVWPR